MDKLHRLDSGIPAVSQHMTKLYLVAQTSFKHTPCLFVFTYRAPLLPLAFLLIPYRQRLLHSFVTYRHAHSISFIEDIHNIDAFDASALTVVIVPAHQFTLVGVRFFLNRVVDNQHTVIALDLAY